MPYHQETVLTVRMPHFDGVDITNDDRAALVDPLLRAWAAAYYTLDFRPGEPLCDYMVSDFLADLMHWCDRVPVRDYEGEERCVDFTELTDMARMHYDEEVAEEVADQRLVCSACGRIGNQDDLCFDREPCPDEECGGMMSVYNERTDDAPL